MRRVGGATSRVEPRHLDGAGFDPPEEGGEGAGGEPCQDDDDDHDEEARNPGQQSFSDRRERVDEELRQLLADRARRREPGQDGVEPGEDHGDVKDEEEKAESEPESDEERLPREVLGSSHLHRLEALRHIQGEPLPDPARDPLEEDEEPPREERGPGGLGRGREKPLSVVPLVVLRHDDGEPLLRPGHGRVEGLPGERVEVGGGEEENAPPVELDEFAFERIPDGDRTGPAGREHILDAGHRGQGALPRAETQDRAPEDRHVPAPDDDGGRLVGRGGPGAEGEPGQKQEDADSDAPSPPHPRPFRTSVRPPQ